MLVSAAIHISHSVGNNKMKDSNTFADNILLLRKSNYMYTSNM